MKFDNEARQLNSLTQPILLDRLIGYRGFKALAFVGGSADRLFSIDTDLAQPYWTTHLTYAAATGGQPPSSWDCPGGLIATPSRRTPLAPSAFGGGGGGGGGRATSAVGEPGKGAAVLSQAAAPRQPAPAARRRRRRRAGRRAVLRADSVRRRRSALRGRQRRAAAHAARERRRDDRAAGAVPAARAPGRRR